MFDIKSFRKKNKITQEDLASNLGVGQSFLSKIENGKEKAPETLLNKIITIYGSDIIDKEDSEGSVKDRLTEFLNLKGMSKTEFGRRIGVSSAYISSIRKSIQPDKIKSIALEFPDLNIEWLLTGDGNPITENSANQASSRLSEDFGSKIAFEKTDNLNTNPNSEIGMNGSILKQLCDSITMKDQQINRLLTIIENKDDQINRAFSLMERGSGVSNNEPQKKEPNL